VASSSQALLPIYFVALIWIAIQAAQWSLLQACSILGPSKGGAGLYAELKPFGLSYFLGACEKPMAGQHSMLAGRAALGWILHRIVITYTRKRLWT
jgi:hypothetical protein